MPGLLINRKKLIKYNMSNLLKNLKEPPPKTKYNIGVIFIIPISNLHKIENMTKQNKILINYLNSEKFIKHISASYYIIYDAKKNICELQGHVNHLPDILYSINKYLPHDLIIWSGDIP